MADGCARGVAADDGIADRTCDVEPPAKILFTLSAEALGDVLRQHPAATAAMTSNDLCRITGLVW